MGGRIVNMHYVLLLGELSTRHCEVLKPRDTLKTLRTEGPVELFPPLVAYLQQHEVKFNSDTRP